MRVKVSSFLVFLFIFFVFVDVLFYCDKNCFGVYVLSRILIVFCFVFCCEFIWFCKFIVLFYIICSVVGFFCICLDFVNFFFEDFCFFVEYIIEYILLIERYNVFIFDKMWEIMKIFFFLGLGLFVVCVGDVCI